MLIEILHTAGCPNADPIIARARMVASVHEHMVVTTVLVEEGHPVPDGFAGSPTVLLDGTNPFGGLRADAPVCALHPPTAAQVERAMLGGETAA